MLNIQFTLFDNDNFYQQGLRWVLQNYMDTLNEHYRRAPQLMPPEFTNLNRLEIIFRSQDENLGCASCYKSPHLTLRHQQMTIMIMDAPKSGYSDSPKALVIYRHDSISLVRHKLQLALERFSQRPWTTSHASSTHKCQKCRLAELSNCEKRVLKLMSTGMSASTIANTLERSQKTISAHKRSAMRKLNVKKSTELHKILLRVKAISQPRFG